MLCVGPAIIWAVAIGGVVFGRITLIATVAPVIVLVVGVSDVVHLITQYRHELARGHPRNEAIRLSFSHVGAACTLTSVTTLIGFGSMIFVPLPTAQELGVTAGIGVVAAFMLSFVLTPILLSYTTPTEKDRQEAAEPDWMSHLLAGIGAFIRPRPGIVAAAGLLLTAVTIGVLLTHRVENSLTRKLKPGHPLRQSVKTVEANLGSSAEIEILIDTGKRGGVKDPAVINGLAALRTRLEEVPYVSETLSVLDPLERMHALMAPEMARKTPIPAETREQVAQYFLLFEMSGGEELDALMDASGQHTRIILRGVDGTAEEVIEAAKDYDRWAAEELPDGTTAATNGIGLLAARLGPAIFEATLQGFGGALLLIAVMLGLLFRSVRVGALSLIPNLLPVAAGLVFVPILFEQIDVDTLTFIPVCVGIAVDDTIHFLARFRIERRKGLGRADAVTATIREAGHGIMRTSVVLIVGFSVCLLADYQPVAIVGLLLPATLVAAVVMDLTLAPAMAQLGWIDAR
jgi:predicted RND superfamily exporter protein